ncbi:hypothetical protein OI25_7916 (plasmid) [Paraburkholderia fungorum]|jgi:hypothetical protein|uniref:Preprotein translocase subunit SecA n=1 Tax=Paraburkholderia fungorum TaxID=134537 RepID=A0AAU8STP3_9BURK|nr:hypothetical protein OI25_7916 [Paraburkholderia fungorum]MBB5545057.1 hypothetical protein [Paraburkholderia fungorum]QLD54035.1 hypothetical protein C9419_33830 [Paraburkholderia fungorum]
MKRLLSHHEIAILLLIFSGPAQVAIADPDAMILRQESLLEVVATASSGSEFRLTQEGAEVLRRLGTAGIS